MTKKLSNDEFKERCSIIHNNLYDYSLVEYKNSDSIVTIICLIHGPFHQRASNHLRRKSGCPICANKKRNKNNKKTHEIALKEIKERNKYHSPVYFIKGEIYKTAKDIYNWECEYGHSWSSKFNDIVKNGHGCPICAVKRREETNLKKYGAKYYTQRHLSNTQLNKLDDPEWLSMQHTSGKTWEEIAKNVGVTPKVVASRFHSFDLDHLQFSKSQIERDFEEHIKSLWTGEIVFNTRNLIPPNEIDVYIPDLKLGIELNGIFWHSEFHANRDKKYHLNKTEVCIEKDIQLIQIWENELLLKPKIVESRVKSMLGLNEKIYARKCKIVEPDSTDSSEFLNNTHIQGNKASDIKIGLTYNDRLVAVMLFGKSRYAKKYEYELIRYSSLLNTNVVGGASKLLKYFKDVYMPTSIISYADRRWNSGKMYEILGLSFSHNSNPNYYYFFSNKPLILYSRIAFQKHKLKDKLEVFDPRLSEWENMKANGYDRIWDCGNSVYIWEC